MFGKASVILVIGFGIIFSGYQTRLSRMTARATDTFNLHYTRSFVHEATNSGMNIAINEVWDNATDSLDHTIYSPNCTTDVRIRPIGTDTIRVDVTTRSYVVVEDYWADHNAPMMVTDSSYAIFSYEQPVSRWFWFTNQEALHSGQRVYWTHRDTVWGPMHTNGILYTFGNATFYGKVTSRLGFHPDPRHSPANYYGGWEVGVDAGVPTDMSRIVTAALSDGGSINQKARYDTDLWLDFQADGTVRRAIGEGINWSVDPADWDTLSLGTMAPTGVITASGNIHVKGTVNGQVTVYSSGADKDIWIDDDLVYANDPLVDETSDDVIGLVSARNIMLAENAATNDGATIMAAMIAVNGSFMAEDWDSRPPAVSPLKVVGSIVQDHRGPVGTVSGWGSWLTSGFWKNYHYDPRLATMSPPVYPFVSSLHLSSWWE